VKKTRRNKIAEARFDPIGSQWALTATKGLASSRNAAFSMCFEPKASQPDGLRRKNVIGNLLTPYCCETMTMLILVP
jgi:hypothetical protein